MFCGRGVCWEANEFWGLVCVGGLLCVAGLCVLEVGMCWEFVVSLMARVCWRLVCVEGWCVC